MLVQVRLEATIIQGATLNRNVRTILDLLTVHVTISIPVVGITIVVDGFNLGIHRIDVKEEYDRNGEESNPQDNPCDNRVRYCRMVNSAIAVAFRSSEVQMVSPRFFSINEALL